MVNKQVQATFDTAEIGDLEFLGYRDKAGYKVCFDTEENVLATHKEIAILRECSNRLKAQPDNRLRIVSPEQKPQTRFIVNTLMHLGVSCGQIELLSNSGKAANNEIWLFVN